MNTLRKLFGTRSRFHLAHEDFEPGQAPTTEDTTVVMKGPLADVYSEALMKTFDKETPVDNGGADPTKSPDTPAVLPTDASGTAAETTPDETKAEVDTSNLNPIQGETEETVEAAIVSEVGNIVLESQAIDATVASAFAAAVSDTPPDNNAGYETLYAVDSTQVTPETVVDVTNTLREADSPENVTVLIDDVVPEELLDANAPTVSNTDELVPALESLVTALGGRVARSFPAYLKQRAERSAK